jgi:hypothetical protein
MQGTCTYLNHNENIGMAVEEGARVCKVFGVPNADIDLERPSANKILSQNGSKCSGVKEGVAPSWDQKCPQSLHLCSTQAARDRVPSDQISSVLWRLPGNIQAVAFP